MSNIDVRNLSKRFGDLTAVDDVTLSVDTGEVLCLLGPSGCGKTTTLRVIAGLEAASAGEVVIAGENMTHMAPAQRDIAMVFQFYALYPSLTVRQNLAFPLEAEKRPCDEIAHRVGDIAHKLHLDEFLDRIPGRLAEGEKQRVAVARAIVRDPNCFLFDEPLSRLDVELRQAMRGQIKEVLSDLSKATVIVTHDQLEALTMADRIAVMRAGHIEQVATPHEIFSRPCNTFVAGFIGTPQMNLLAASLVERDEEGGTFRVGEQQVRLKLAPETVSAMTTVADGGDVTLGIRPRAYEIAPGEGPDTVSAKVDIVEPMGAEVLVHMLDGEHDLRVVVPRGTAVESGERLHVRCKPELAHVFDSQGELVRA